MNRFQEFPGIHIQYATFCWKMNKYSMWEWMKHLAERFSIGREFVVYVCLEPLGNMGTRNALLGTENVLGCFLCITQASASSLWIQHKNCFISRTFSFFFLKNLVLWLDFRLQFYGQSIHPGGIVTFSLLKTRTTTVYWMNIIFIKWHFHICLVNFFLSQVAINKGKIKKERNGSNLSKE